MTKIEAEAILLIEAVQTELFLGTKHCRKSTGERLNSAKKILEALRDNDLIIEPISSRQLIFRHMVK